MMDIFGEIYFGDRRKVIRLKVSKEVKYPHKRRKLNGRL